MCPFKKAFPFVLLVHLLAVVGVVGVRAHEDRGVFTLMPAIGVGEGATVTTQEIAAAGPVAQAPQNPQKQEVSEEKQKESTPVLAMSTAREIPAAVENFSEKIQQAVSASAGVAGAKIENAREQMGGAAAEKNVSGAITPPVALMRPKPARPAGELAGRVVLIFTINEKGQVSQPTIEESTSAVLTNEVLKVLPRWKFSPARKNGQVMSLKVRQVVEF